MKGTGKRVLSVSLSVMMALGMPSGTFAAAPDTEVAGQVSEAEVPVTTEPEATVEVTQQVTETSETTKEPVKEEATQEEKETESKQEKAEAATETKDSAADAETVKELPDLKVTKTELIETKDEYLVTVYTDSDVYDQLYVGKKEDTEKKTVVEGKKSPNGQYTFQFVVSEEKLGSKLQIVPGMKASGEWYTKEDVFCQVPEKSQTASAKTETKEQTQAEDQKEEKSVVTTADNSSTAENVIKAVYATDEANGDKAGTDYSMFKIAKSSATLNGDQIDVEIYVSPASSGRFTYDALYIGRWDDETKEPLVMGEVDTELNLEKFAFSVPAEKNGQEVIFVPRNGRTQKFSSSKIALKLPTLGSTDTDPEPTTAPSVPDGSKVENSITAEKADGSAFTMFNVEKSTATVNGENINIELYLKANASGKFSYTGIYLGSKEDEEKTPVIEGTINEDNNQVYKFSIPLSKAGTKLQFVPIPFINISVIQHLIPLPNDFYIPVLVLQPNHRHHRISLFPLLAAKLHIFLYPYHSIIHNPYFPYIKTLNYLLFICYNITPPPPLQERIQTHQTTTMRNTLCEFLKLSRQSPRFHASMDFGSLLA